MSATLELERATLGGLLQYPELLDIEQISANQWYDNRHGAVVSAMRGMRVAHQPIDLITVAEVIRRLWPTIWPEYAAIQT